MAHQEGAEVIELSRPAMHGAYVNLMLAGVRDRPRSVRAALAHSGIEPNSLNDPIERNTSRQFGRLMTELMATTDDELARLGGRPIRRGTFVTLCRILVLAPTLGESLRLGSDFYRSLTDDFTIRVHRHDGEAALVVKTRPVEDDRAYMLHSMVVFAAYAVACWLVGRRIPLRTLDVAFPARTGAAYASQVFRAPTIRYERGNTSKLTFDSSWLDRPVMADDRSTDEFIGALPETMLRGYRDCRTAAERLRVLLRRQLASPPDIRQAAELLGVSQQTLRRQLRRENHTYQELKDEVRLGAAADMLQDSTVSVEQVGMMLGFAELSSFHRAFKRWTGSTPGQHRQHYNGVGRVNGMARDC
jgi:AraC-like DNA-binding protein